MEDFGISGLILVDFDAEEILKELHSKYEYLGSGLSRAVFKLKGNHVLKFPLNPKGERDNDWEGSVCTNIGKSDPDEEVQYPNTRHFDIGGFICCVMEYVTPVTDTADVKLPDWVNNVDCTQVGYNKRGNLVAYDYGY